MIYHNNPPSQSLVANALHALNLNSRTQLKLKNQQGWRIATFQHTYTAFACLLDPAARLTDLIAGVQQCAVGFRLGAIRTQ
jgi:hypothetical protein